jgi:hypothetical protein
LRRCVRRVRTWPDHSVASCYRVFVSATCSLHTMCLSLPCDSFCTSCNVLLT